MSTSDDLKQIYAAGRPLVEQALDIAEQLAEKLSLERSTVTKLRLGKSKPSFDVLMQIQRLSENAVTANDFAEAAQ